MTLKCWFAGDCDPNEFPCVAAVFANSEDEAKQVVWLGSRDIREECDGQMERVTLYRQAHHDYLAVGTESYVLKDEKILWELGWHEEGAEQCMCCSRYAHDKFLRVDYGSQMCEECKLGGWE